MGLIRKVASIMMLSGVSRHARRKPPGTPARARAKAEGAQEKAAQAQAVRADAEAKVAKEQAAAIARALHEDEVSPATRPCRSRRGVAFVSYATATP